MRLKSEHRIACIAQVNRSRDAGTAVSVARASHVEVAFLHHKVTAVALGIVVLLDPRVAPVGVAIVVGEAAGDKVVRCPSAVAFAG